MERAPHRPGLEQAPVAQSAVDLSPSGGLAPNADRELRRRGNLCLHAAEATDDLRDRRPAHRIEQVWRRMRQARACDQLTSTVMR